jgi:hypothetical protein
VISDSYVLEVWRDWGWGGYFSNVARGGIYALWMNISRPPLEGINGIPLLLKHLVGVLVLLNNNLY